MDFSEIKNIDKNFVLQTYGRTDLCMVKGDDIWVEDIKGTRYLDFFPGWAVSGVGHCNRHVVRRLKEQAEKILHVPNIYYNELQPILAKKIIEHSFSGKVFFANSGAEANEAAIKLSRKWGGKERYEIITMEKSFHGRTMATLSATGQEKVKKGFDPVLEGFRHVPYGDIRALEAAVSSRTCAVMLEPVQGEGGVNIPDRGYLEAVRKITEEKGILLIFDEVQTCMGRCGEMFAYKVFGVKPDLMTLAKSLGGGLPIGALVASEEYSEVLEAGSHASTFGGSPIVCAAALGVFEAIEQDGLLENVHKMGAYLLERLEHLSNETRGIRKIKALGLMVGVEMDMPDAVFLVEECRKEGLLINCTQKNILRLMPPITVRPEHIDIAYDKLKKVLERI